MSDYFRPIAMQDAARPKGALPLAGGWCWFDRAERLTRDGVSELVPADALPKDVLARLTSPRMPVAGVSMDTPRLMGILNVTPDSFSDGGAFLSRDAALVQAGRIVKDGADLLDIGGESTRPGAVEVTETEEIARTVPVIEAVRDASPAISIDTRKAGVARAALQAGARMLNDVSAMTYDPGMAQLAAASEAPICLMHAQGDPATMQADPRYVNVLLDVFDFLLARLAVAERAGIARDRVILDPGIGFGKTVQHNLSLIQGFSLFHGLGCPLLLGASRKRFIGTISGTDEACDRTSGSLAVALEGVAQGAQILRIHDVAETRQALSLQAAVQGRR